MAIGLSVGAVATDALPVAAGTCQGRAPTVQKDGFYYTYSHFSTSTSGYHRVKVVKGGSTQYSPWKWGYGITSITLYHGNSPGYAQCQEK